MAHPTSVEHTDSDPRASSATRVRLALLLLAVGALLAGPPVAASADGYRDPIDLTFPVAGETWFTEDYHDCRSGCTRRHRATDIMVPEYGQAVHAAIGGTVVWITGLDGNPPGYGYMISIRGDDGREYGYVHLGRQDGPPSEAYAPGIGDGTRVERGQLIGYAGCSGNAACSAPHLHFSIEDPAVSDPYGSNYRDPYNSLVAAEERGDVAGTDGAGRSALAGGTPIVGDWDGDGVDTRGWFKDGTVRLEGASAADGTVNRSSSGKQYVEFSYGRAGDVPIVGDWDGDGVDTLGIVRAGGEWHLKNSHESGSADLTFTYGRAGARGDDVPIAGDWNGDGVDTPGIVRDGEWHLRNRASGGPSHVRFVYGRVGPRGDDRPIVGDWNGDGADEIGVIRDGVWYLRTQHAGGAADIAFEYGQPEDAVVVGDWTGEGLDRPAVVRASEWHERYDYGPGPAHEIRIF